MKMLLPTLLVASLLAWPAMAACEPRQTEVRVTESVAQPKIDFSKTANQIKDLKTGDTMANDFKYAEMTGVTDATISVDSEIRTTASGPANGPACIWPSVISVKLSTAPTIYVDASHGDCRKNVALEHEMGHVESDRQVIERYIPIVRNHVTLLAEAIGSVPASSYDSLSAVRGRIEDKVNALLTVIDDALIADRAAAAQAHDTLDEYRRVSMACQSVTVDTPGTAPHGDRKHGT
ncbi:MAG TPA: hypothetical protein VL899_01975 [Alphaproteobacteria bacterium]|jgi:hypothetical protein|nr:hypothetical protein [Alphaproteobacteria bacterium]